MSLSSVTGMKSPPSYKKYQCHFLLIVCTSNSSSLFVKGSIESSTALVVRRSRVNTCAPRNKVYNSSTCVHNLERQTIYLQCWFPSSHHLFCVQDHLILSTLQLPRHYSGIITLCARVHMHAYMSVCMYYSSSCNSVLHKHT